MLDNPSFWILFAAYTVVWVVIGGYVISLVRRQRDLEREIASLEQRIDKRD